MHVAHRIYTVCLFRRGRAREKREKPRGLACLRREEPGCDGIVLPDNAAPATGQGTRY